MSRTEESQHALHIRLHTHQHRLTYPAHRHGLAEAPTEQQHRRSREGGSPRRSPNMPSPSHPPPHAPFNASLKAQGILGLLDDRESSYRTFESLKAAEIQRMKHLDARPPKCNFPERELVRMAMIPKRDLTSSSSRTSRKDVWSHEHMARIGPSSSVRHADRRHGAQPSHSAAADRDHHVHPDPVAETPAAATLAKFQWPLEDESNIHPALRTHSSVSPHQAYPSVSSTRSPRQRPMSTPTTPSARASARISTPRTETFFFASDDEDDDADVEDDDHDLQVVQYSDDLEYAETIVGGESDDESDTLAAQKRRMRPVLAPIDTHLDQDANPAISQSQVVTTVSEVIAEMSPYAEEAAAELVDEPEEPPAIPMRSSRRPHSAGMTTATNTQDVAVPPRASSCPRLKNQKATDGLQATLATIEEGDQNSILEGISTPELSAAEDSSPSSPSSISDSSRALLEPAHQYMQPWTALQMNAKEELPSRQSPHLTKDKANRKNMTLSGLRTQSHWT